MVGIPDKYPLACRMIIVSYHWRSRDKSRYVISVPVSRSVRCRREVERAGAKLCFVPTMLSASGGRKAVLHGLFRITLRVWFFPTLAWARWQAHCLPWLGTFLATTRWRRRPPVPLRTGSVPLPAARLTLADKCINTQYIVKKVSC